MALGSAYRIRETDVRVDTPDPETAIASRHWTGWWARRRALRLNRERSSLSFRWVAVAEGERWAVVAFQNVVVPIGGRKLRGTLHLTTGADGHHHETPEP